MIFFGGERKMQQKYIKSICAVYTESIEND